MWRLWHKLFGWDYVTHNDYWGHAKFDRIHTTPNGIEYIKGNSGFVRLAPSHIHVTRKDK